MNIRDLVPASELAKVFGVKALCYGPAGCGKTPTIITAPSPVILVCEPGARSLSKFTTLPAYEAYSVERIDEFWLWLCGSHEAKQFQTFGADSVSQMAEIKLAQEMARNTNKLRAYGEMANWVDDKLKRLYFLPEKHIYLVAKEEIIDFGAGKRARPYFPGKELHVRIPHLFDCIFRMERIPHPDPKMAGQTVPAFRTKDDGYAHARSRFEALAEYEPTDLTYVIKKAMQ